MKRIRDPIHGFVVLDDLEVALLDTRPFQRLRHVSQLAMTDLVYPGATHVRFAHVLGVAHVATRMFEAIRAERGARAEIGASDAEWDRAGRLLRLAALCHDLGHAPFSHAAESLFGPGRRHEDVSLALLRNGEVAEILRSHPHARDEGLGPEDVAAVIEGRGEGPLALASALLSGPLDADRADYLLRDSLCCGVDYGRFDLERLIATLTARRDGDGRPRVAVRTGGLCAAEAMVSARYLMYREVYFHKTRRMYDRLLTEALAVVLPGGRWPEGTEEYLEWTDARVWEELRRLDRERPGGPWTALVLRRAPRCVLQVEHTASNGARALFEQVVRGLEEEAGLGPGSLWVDTGADIHVYRPGQPDVPVVDEHGRSRPLFQLSTLLRGLDPTAEILRAYVCRERADEARAYVARFLKGFPDPRQLRFAF